MFQPIIPETGLVGWRFLQRTYDAQFEAFSNSSVIQRDADYFRENIAEVKTAEQLVSDRRLLTVALGAFGLQDDINNRYYIQKVLEEGTSNDDALANRIADPKYRELSEAFGFGPGEVLRTGWVDFGDDIVSQFETSEFEVAAGAQSDAMRIGLYAQRTLPELANDDVSNDAKWFTILGDPPLRQMMEKALGLPGSIGQIDLDQQLGIFKDRAISVFGSDDVSQFADEAVREDAISRFLVRDQIDGLGNGLSSNSIALALLGG